MVLTLIKHREREGDLLTISSIYGDVTYTRGTRDTFNKDKEYLLIFEDHFQVDIQFFPKVQFDAVRLGNIVQMFTTPVDNWDEPVPSSSPVVIPSSKDPVIVRRAKFFYEASNLTYDYKVTDPDELSGACSAFMHSQFVGRSYDWMYDNALQFMVRTDSTIGIASYSKLTEETLDNPYYLQILPNFTQDAINTSGLHISILVAPADFGPIYYNMESEFSIASTTLVRYLIDNCTSVNSAFDIVRSIGVFDPPALTDMGYTVHFFLADSTGSYVLEFKGSEVYLTESSICTNFYIHGTNIGLNFDRFESTLSPHSSGIERYNVIYGGLGVKSVAELLEDVKYSHTYTDLNWPTEFVGGNLLVNSPIEDFESIMTKAQQAYIDRDRDNPLVWISTHQCIYDIYSRTLTVWVEEKQQSWTYALQV